MAAFRSRHRRTKEDLAHAICFALATSILLVAFATDAVAETPRPRGDLELVLAVDVSDSMSPAELELQRKGYVQALRHPDIVNAIRWGAYRRIGVTYLEWAGPGHQQVLVPWTLIDDQASAERFAMQVEKAPQTTGPGTAISEALRAGTILFRTSPFWSSRWTIDISGDGPGNSGPPVVPVRNWVMENGVSINALPVVLPVQQGDRFTHYDAMYLGEYFENCVIAGPSAFVAEAATIDAFSEAILRKLVREIAGTPAKLMHAKASVITATTFDCETLANRPGR